LRIPIELQNETLLRSLSFCFSFPYLENINLILNRIPVESPSKSKIEKLQSQCLKFSFLHKSKTVKLLTNQTVKNGQRSIRFFKPIESKSTPQIKQQNRLSERSNSTVNLSQACV
jgi:hypothetical protein